MPSMTYCRHENTASEMSQVVDLWDDYQPESANEYEQRGRLSVIALAVEIVEIAFDNGELEAPKLRTIIAGIADDIEATR